MLAEYNYSCLNPVHQGMGKQRPLQISLCSQINLSK